MLSLTGAGALLVNWLCAYILLGFRKHQNSLIRAAFLSARNDILGDIGIIIAALVTSVTVSALPDLIVGLGLFLINLDAAYEVYQIANKEYAQS